MKRRLGCFAAICVGLVLLALVWIAIEGVAKVTDHSGQVVAARITNGAGGGQPMYEIIDGVFVTFVRLDGSIVVECRDGSTRRLGYVTQHLDTSVEVPKGGNCSNARLL